MVVRGTDDLYPILAIDFLPPLAGILFLLGLIAAAYSSADSALAALTTSFCVDFLGFERRMFANAAIEDGGVADKKLSGIRKKVQLGFSALTFLIILGFKSLNNDAIISQIFKAAGFTYGPLLGLFAFGLFTRIKVKDQWVWLVCILSVVISILLNSLAPKLGYTIGFEILIYNGLITFFGLMAISKKKVAGED